VKQRKPTKTWEKTRLQNLVRHKSGRYYARAYAGGKEFWKSLKTSHFSVAQAKLAEFMRDHRQRVGNTREKVSAKITFGEAAEIHLGDLEDDTEIKETTRHYWRQCLAALLKSWPALNEMEVRRITRKDCESWARHYRKTTSPVRFNNTVAVLRHVLRVALDAGVIPYNPAANARGAKKSPLKRRTPNNKLPELPTRAQFLQLVEAIERAGGGCSRDCADFVRGLAFTGVRKSEVAEIEFRDLDFEAGETVVRGDPETATKNWEVRRVPMIADARLLFEKMRRERSDAPLTAKVFRVREAQRAIDRACKKIGIARITHHDLRHLFATTCIESGIDIPTVSRWLGHSDGGALLMKTYGHLRREHSIAQARRVNFAPSIGMKADIITFPESTDVDAEAK
jgi:integrase